MNLGENLKGMMINESVQIVTLAEVKQVVKLNSGGKPLLSCKSESDGKPAHKNRAKPGFTFGRFCGRVAMVRFLFFRAVHALKRLFDIVSARLDECISKGSER